MKKGFTLLELLIVIGILAVLSTAVVLVLNPAQLLAEARDSQRLSDLSAVQSAIALYLITATSPDLVNGDPSGVTSTVTVAGAHCPFNTSSTAPCVEITSAPGLVDGSGWVKAVLTKTTGGSPLAVLPSDPSNVGAYYYAYTATSGPLTFEVNARLESIKFRDKMTQDGGDNNVCAGDYTDTTCYYETGTAPGLNL
jgi:prepilin-type N-terminal cleavage/methylation domain-containing protein